MKIEFKNFLRKLFFFENSEEEEKRKSALEKGNKLEGLLTSMILKNPNVTTLMDYRNIVTSLELIKTPIWSEIDWGTVEFNINTIENIYARYSENFK